MQAASPKTGSGDGKRSLGRRLAKWGVKLMVVLVGAAVVAPFAAMVLHGLLAQPQRADVILVPGAALKNGGDELSDALRFRMNTAIDLWKRGYAPLLVLSGGGEGRWNEAEAMARYAEARGVTRDAMVLDRAAATSRETAENLATALADHGAGAVAPDEGNIAKAVISGGREDELVSAARAALQPYEPAGARVLVVSQWCHVARMRMALQQEGFRAFGAACEHPQFLHNEHWMTLREAAGLWAYALRVESSGWREAVGAE